MKVHYYELWSTFFQNLCSFWLRSVRDDAVSSEDFANMSVCRGHWQTAHNGSPIDSRPHFFSLFNSPGNESDVGDVSQTKSERVFAARLPLPSILCLPCCYQHGQRPNMLKRPPEACKQTRSLCLKAHINKDTAENGQVNALNCSICPTINQKLRAFSRLICRHE